MAYSFDGELLALRVVFAVDPRADLPATQRQQTCYAVGGVNPLPANSGLFRMNASA